MNTYTASPKVQAYSSLRSLFASCVDANGALIPWALHQIRHLDEANRIAPPTTGFHAFLELFQVVRDNCLTCIPVALEPEPQAEPNVYCIHCGDAIPPGDSACACYCADVPGGIYD